jgi:hypothetical protein
MEVKQMHQMSVILRMQASQLRQHSLASRKNAGIRDEVYIGHLRFGTRSEF